MNRNKVKLVVRNSDHKCISITRIDAKFISWPNEQKKMKNSFGTESPMAAALKFPDVRRHSFPIIVISIINIKLIQSPLTVTNEYMMSYYNWMID